jgi:hypothetical protein
VLGLTQLALAALAPSMRPGFWLFPKGVDSSSACKRCKVQEHNHFLWAKILLLHAESREPLDPPPPLALTSF